MDGDLRREYEKNRDRNLTDYWLSVGQEFTHSINRLSKLIGNAHELSTGRYKERLLIDLISNFIPRKYSVGSGFILFPTMTFSETGVINDHQMSGELDIIIYDSTNYSTIFKDKDIVVLKPESVRIIIEVKSALNYKQKDDFMKKFLDFYQKWESLDCLYEKMRYPKLKSPNLYVMNWSVAIDKSGNPKIKVENLPRLIVDYYKKNLGDNINNKLPLINAIFIYHNSMTLLSSTHFELKEYTGYSFHAGILRSTQSTQINSIFHNKDITIAYLLYCLDLILDAQSNTLITHPNCLFQNHILRTQKLIFEKLFENKY